MWNELSMKEKADIIKVGVKHGITRLADIRAKYNEFALGGNLYDEGGPKTRMTADGRTLHYSIVPSTREVRWIDFDDSKDFDGVTGYRFYDNALNKKHYTQWQDNADYLGTEGATGYALPEVEVLGKDLAMRRHRHLDDPLLGGELKDNQYRTMPTQSELNAKADAQDRAYDLTPAFANLMTGLTASQMEEGWKTLLDENSSWRQKASGAANALAPALFTSPWARAYYGLTHLADENGVQKTWNKFVNEGDYAGGAKSLLGDILNATLAAEGSGTAANDLLNFAASRGNQTARGIQLARAINGDVRNTRLNVGEFISGNVATYNPKTADVPTISWSDATNNPTNNLLKWLGRPANYRPEVSLMDTNGKAGIAGSAEEKLMNIFDLNGVDLSRLSREDLTKALEYRIRDIEASAPERYTLVKAQDGSQPLYTLDDIMDGNKVGKTSVKFEDDGNTHISMTSNTTQGKDNPVGQVFERALNSSINLAKSFGGEGVVSGKQYLSAPRQYSVIKKYGNKEVIGNTGQHTNQNMVKKGPLIGKHVSTMEDIMEASDKYVARADNMPIWLLRNPSFPVPTKSNLFDPTIIDSSGKMNIEWLNPNVLRGMFYPTFGSTLLYNSLGND